MSKPWYTRLYEYLTAYEPPDDKSEKPEAVVAREKTTPKLVKIKQRVMRKKRATKK